MSRPKKRKQRGPHPYRHRVTRYYDGDGRRCKKSHPQARRAVESTGTYYADFWDAGHRDRVSLETDDLSVAWQVLHRLLKERQDRLLGIRDRYTDAAAAPLARHLDDWIASVRARGTSADQLDALRAALDLLAELAGWRIITDLDHDSCALALAELMRPTKGRPKGRSAQTRNHYLRHAKQFSRWASGPAGRLKEDPFAALAPIPVETDKRHHRRIPTDEEVATLFEYLESATAAPPLRNNMSGPHRALGYRLAMATGFRADELRSLTRACFDLAAGVVTLPALADKRRREARQALPPWLVEQLAEWFAAGGACWGQIPAKNPGRALKADLAAAGIPYSVKAPAGHDLFLDFHSLRHWYCTWAANLPGISPRTLLTLTRHSTVELAMKVYARGLPDQVAAAVDAMPEIGKAGPKKKPRKRG